MTAVDVTDIMTPVIQAIGVAVAGVVTMVLTQAVGLFKLWLQRQIVTGAVQTSASGIALSVRRGDMSLQDLHSDNAVVTTAAQAALARVPNAAADLGTTPAIATEMLLGAVERSFPPPSAVTADRTPSAG